jgi:hypothetical protein
LLGAVRLLLVEFLSDFAFKFFHRLVFLEKIQIKTSEERFLGRRKRQTNSKKLLFEM